MTTVQTRFLSLAFVAAAVTMAAGSHAQAAGADRTFQLTAVNNAQLPAVFHTTPGWNPHPPGRSTFTQTALSAQPAQSTSPPA